MPQQGRACQRLADTPGTPSSALPRPLARRQCVGRGFGLGRGSLFLLNRKPQRCNIIATRFSFGRSEEHTSELQSLMRISYAVFGLKKKKNNNGSQCTQRI